MERYRISPMCQGCSLAGVAAKYGVQYDDCEKCTEIDHITRLNSRSGKPKYVIKKASDPNWSMDGEYATLDDAINAAKAYAKTKKFVVDTQPWVGFLRDENGDIVRDWHGIAVPEVADFTMITIYDGPIY